MKKTLMVLAMGVAIACCTRATPPLKVEQRTAALPEKGRVTIAAQRSEQVGNVVPIDVNVANGTGAPYRIDPTQVFARSADGRRIAPIPVSDAIKLSGDAVTLGEQIKKAALFGAIGAVAGAAGGAGVGAATGGVAGGAAAGGAMGGVAGAVGGAAEAAQSSRQEAASQIRAYSLENRSVESGYSVSGYVFYPPGDYTGIEALVIGEEGNETISGALVPSPGASGSPGG
jgi:hypothetical protein